MCSQQLPHLVVRGRRHILPLALKERQPSVLSPHSLSLSSHPRFAQPINMLRESLPPHSLLCFHGEHPVSAFTRRPGPLFCPSSLPRVWRNMFCAPAPLERRARRATSTAVWMPGPSARRRRPLRELIRAHEPRAHLPRTRAISIGRTLTRHNAMSAHAALVPSRGAASVLGRHSAEDT